MVHTDVTTMPEAAVTTVVQNGWLETLKAKLQIQTLIDDFNLSAGKIGEVAAWVAIGFFSGFLFKKYFRYALLALIVIVLTLKGLEYFDIAIIDWTRLQQLSGVQATDTFDNFFRYYGNWVKENLTVVLSCSIGFLLGFKLG